MDERYKEVIDRYQKEHISLTRLAKEYKHDRNKIARELKKLGIDVVNRWNATKFDDCVFDSIDTEEKAYWLGFLYADGCVSDGTRTNNIELSLKLSDKDHLEKFKRFLKTPKEVQTDSFRCRLTVTSVYLRKRLIEIGCTPRKSLTLKFPSMEIFKDESLIKHFVRGYVDGDGCLSLIKGWYPTVSILGTTNFLNSLQKDIGIEKTRKLRKNDYKSESDTMVLSFVGKSAISFTKYLYEDSSIYLDRKYKKYQAFLKCRLRGKPPRLLLDKNGER